MKMDGIKLFKLGIICKPPTLVLLYEVSEGPDKGPGRRACRRKRSMPIRDMSKACSSQCGGLAQQLKKRHEKYLGKVSTVVIEKMLRLLYIVTLGNKSVAEAVDEVQTEFTVNLDEDMNRLSDRDLNRRKELMDLTFERNRIKVGDPDFVYDKQVDFSAKSKVESGWDQDEDEEEGSRESEAEAFDDPGIGRGEEEEVEEDDFW